MTVVKDTRERGDFQGKRVLGLVVNMIKRCQVLGYDFGYNVSDVWCIKKEISNSEFNICILHSVS